MLISYIYWNLINNKYTYVSFKVCSVNESTLSNLNWLTFQAEDYNIVMSIWYQNFSSKMIKYSWLLVFVLAPEP